MRNFNSRRVLFDTNILLDAIVETRPQSHEARDALKACNGGGDMGMVTAGSLKDTYYVLSRAYDEETARQAIQKLLGLLVVLPLGAEEAVTAATSSEPDYEDALVRAAAELNDVSFILTRDEGAFNNSPIRKLTCKEYLRIRAAER